MNHWTYTVLFFLTIGVFNINAQKLTYEYEESSEHPFGRPNPKAAKNISDYAPMIGECDCKSYKRNQDLTWAEPVDMIWRFKYIMNGMAVQDESLKEDGSHAGSIRQYISDSSAWFVHYYNSQAPAAALPTWEGGYSEDGAIVLYKEHKAPNGMDGFYRLTFTEITSKGFNWIGEWVDPTESYEQATWKIECIKRSMAKPRHE